METIDNYIAHIQDKKPENWTRMLEGAKSLKERSNIENRIAILNGDIRVIRGNCEARCNIAKDPVYQMLKKEWCQEDEAFNELRKEIQI